AEWPGRSRKRPARPGAVDGRRSHGAGLSGHSRDRAVVGAGGALMKALTGNRLDDGEVVFWRAGAWVERFAEADLWEDDDPAAEAAEAHGKTEITKVVEPYLI